MQEIPKQELLVKLLMMTTSSNDGEALTAIRKANELLKTQGWDWVKLIAGKITIVEDPFKDLAMPEVRQSYSPPPPYTSSYNTPPRQAKPRRKQFKQFKPNLTLNDLGL